MENEAGGGDWMDWGRGSMKDREERVGWTGEEAACRMGRREVGWTGEEAV